MFYGTSFRGRKGDRSATELQLSQSRTGQGQLYASMPGICCPEMRPLRMNEQRNMSVWHLNDPVLCSTFSHPFILWMIEL